MSCENCVNYGIYEMITSGKPYGYSGDIPCNRCSRYGIFEDLYIENTLSKPSEGFNIQSFDARDWAKEFNRILVTKNEQPYDEGWLISWFANAIMAGYDKAKRESSKPSVEIDGEKFAPCPDCNYPWRMVTKPSVSGLTITCDFCHSQLTEPGALIYSPPNKDNKVIKMHMCEACYVSYSLKPSVPSVVYVVCVSDCESTQIIAVCLTEEIAKKELFKTRDRLITEWKEIDIASRKDREEFCKKENKEMWEDNMYKDMITALSGDDYEKWNNYPHDVPYIAIHNLLTGGS